MTGETTFVEIIDLCGREEPRIVDLSAIKDVTELDDGDIDHILDMWADGNSAFIGEFEYREAAARPDRLR